MYTYIFTITKRFTLYSNECVLFCPLLYSSLYSSSTARDWKSVSKCSLLFFSKYRIKYIGHLQCLFAILIFPVKRHREPTSFEYCGYFITSALAFAVTPPGQHNYVTHERNLGIRNKAFGHLMDVNWQT